MIIDISIDLFQTKSAFKKLPEKISANKEVIMLAILKHINPIHIYNVIKRDNFLSFDPFKRETTKENK